MSGLTTFILAEASSSWQTKIVGLFVMSDNKFKSKLASAVQYFCRFSVFHPSPALPCECFAVGQEIKEQGRCTSIETALSSMLSRFPASMATIRQTSA